VVPAPVQEQPHDVQRARARAEARQQDHPLRMGGPAQMKADADRAAEVERLLEEKLARWMTLEDKAKAAAEKA